MNVARAFLGPSRAAPLALFAPTLFALHLGLARVRRAELHASRTFACTRTELDGCGGGAALRQKSRAVGTFRAGPGFRW